MSNRRSRTRRRAKRSSGQNQTWLLLLVVGVIVAGLVIWLVLQNVSSNGETEESITTDIGPATLCQQLPEFVGSIGLGQPVFIDTSQQVVTGVALQEAADGGRLYQHPSWDDAGNVGPYVVDKDGNIYVAPVPMVSLFNNPPEEQNKIYRIDSRTGVMQEFINLPWDQPPSGANPFGVVGLAYDCDTHSLYAASVAGSAPNQELGRLHRIDLTTGQVVDQQEAVDALGLGVFTGRQGKRLYYGAARTPDVYSIALDESGDFTGQARFEFSLAALEGGSQDNAHRLRFNRDNTLEIKGIEFGFKLMAVSDPQRNIYQLHYNPESDTWQVESVVSDQSVR